MPPTLSAVPEISTWGSFRVTVDTFPEANYPSKDVTYFRDVPVQIDSFVYSDPFGDSSATLTFPQVSPLDDMGTGDLYWMTQWANINIWRVDESNQTGEIIWEGMIAAIDASINGADYGVTLTCIGALYQVDLMLAYPQYLNEQAYYEDIIKQYFDKSLHPSLRTSASLAIRFPQDWPLQHNNKDVTGVKTRHTGSWDKALTGYVNEALSYMYTPTDERWTILKEPNRTPVMQVRDRYTQHWQVYVGMPGVECNLSRDFSQTFNMVYGEGESSAGTEWRNSVVSDDGQRTDYLPIAYDNRVWPRPMPRGSFVPSYSNTDGSSYIDLRYPEIHTFMSYGAGFDQLDAEDSASQLLRRDLDPGWTGTVSLTSDPRNGSRFDIRAGQNITLVGMGGTGRRGLACHVAQAEHTPEMTILHVDTKGRDLFTLEQIIARNRDSRTPQRIMKVGVTSGVIEDKVAPWDYTAGSGYGTTASKKMWTAYIKAHDNLTPAFPWTDMTRAYPPRNHPDYYVKCQAGAKSRKGRWAVATVLMSTEGTIRLTQVVCVDRNGNPKMIPFHVGVYAVNPANQDGYPRDAGGPSPFIQGAFHTKTDDILAPGEETIYTATKMMDEQMITGWGDYDQWAGYSPGISHKPGDEHVLSGDPPTGRLVDETPWSYSLSNYEGPGGSRNKRAVYVAFYAQHDVEPNEYVYFLLRFYRMMEGVT